MIRMQMKRRRDSSSSVAPRIQMRILRPKWRKSKRQMTMTRLVRRGKPHHQGHPFTLL